MPPNIKFQTAVLQAKAQAGLTEETILGAFDKLKAQLQHEQEAFGVKAQQFSDHEIAARQDRITQISSQITQLQQELGKLSSELVEAQGKGTRAQSQFAAAVQRRGIEIEQQKAQYSALLKG
jgi:predicted  nucleic acid-binding Zn-ribbon protein